jgi:hypothetical protein
VRRYRQLRRTTGNRVAPSRTQSADDPNALDRALKMIAEKKQKPAEKRS